MRHRAPTVLFEELESRDTPAVMLGTPGNDVFVVSSLWNDIIVWKLVQNGQLQISNSIVDALELDMLGGNDHVVNICEHPISIDLGDGNDIADGGEGGGFSVLGGLGDDTINGSIFSDTLIGAGGGDVLTGREGNDILIGGDTLAPVQWNSSAPTHINVVDITRYSQPQDDGAHDTLISGTGFDLLFNDVEREIEISQNGNVLSADPTNFRSVIAAAQLGSIVEFAPGNYVCDTPIAGDLWGITLRGAGMGVTTIAGAAFDLNNAGNDTPTLIEDLTIDLTGSPPITKSVGQSYNIFQNGTFYFEDLEVFGAGTANVCALYFAAPLHVVTKAYLADLNVHDLAGDGISTGGVTGYTDPACIVEVYDTTVTRPGPNANNQCLTAHFGFNAVAVGGHYSDAALNVVAPDNVTRIDLYYVTITAGARLSGISIPIVDSVIFGCSIDVNTYFSVHGSIEQSTITNRTALFANTINMMLGSRIVGCHIVNQGTANSNAVRLRQDNVTVIDNVFEGWAANRDIVLYPGTTGHVISGNVNI